MSYSKIRWREKREHNHDFREAQKPLFLRPF